MKNVLKWCAILNFIVALLFRTGSNSSLFNTMFLVVTGLYYLLCSNLSNEELEKHKTTLIVLGVVSIFFNFLTAFVLLFNIKYINNLGKENHIVTKIDKETIRVDLLLKLGVFMIIMAGVIFAMTTWDNIYSMVKVISLITMSGLFLGLSIFTERKLKIKQSTKTYWILSMVFLALSYLAAENLGVLGSWFSMAGKGNTLFASSFTLLIAILSFVTYIKFRNKSSFYLFLSMIFLSLICFLGFLYIDFNIILLVVVLLNAMLYLFNKGTNIITKCLKSFSLVTTFVLTMLILLLGNPMSGNIIVLFVSSIILLVNIIYIVCKEKNTLPAVISPLLLLLLIANSLNYLSLTSSKFILLLSLIYFTIYIIPLTFKILDKNKTFNISFVSIINMSFVILFFSSFFVDSSIVLIVSTLGLISNISSNYIFAKNNPIKIEYYLQPFKILMVVASIIYWVSINIFFISSLWYLCIAYLLMFVFYFVTKEVKLKNIYFISFTTTLVTSLYVDLLSTQMIPSIFILVSFFGLYLLINSLKSKTYNNISIPIFIITLVVTYLLMVNANAFNLDIIYSSTIVLIIYLVLAFVYRKNKMLYTITYLALLIPFTSFITNFVTNYQLSITLISSLFLYVTFLLCENYIVNDKYKNIVSGLFTSIILISIVFNEGLIVGLFVGLISIVLIFIGFLNSHYRFLLKVGIGFTILNIIVQFQNLWKEIPFWLYLLISGLLLIGIVTYKEIKKIDK